MRSGPPVTRQASVKVLYVLGTQRGGTTITGRLAGAMPGFAYAGELRKLWELGIPEHRDCGCGQAYADCPIWSQVLPSVLRDDDAASVRAWQSAAAPDRHSSWRTFRAAGAASAPEDHLAAKYAAVNERLYEAFALATGARVVVDSSKLPADALLLARSAVDAYFLHVVRDPRGLVQSLISRRRGSKVANPGASVTGSLLWMARHAASSRVRDAVPSSKSLVVSFEDLLRNPEAVLGRVAALVQEPPPPPDLVAAGWAALPTAHTPIGGGKFRDAVVEIVTDERWSRSLGSIDFLITTVLTSPLRRRFGYGMRRNRRQAAAEQS